MHEIELKFGIPPEGLDGLRKALLSQGAKPVQLAARYFDTIDGRLADHRVALRLRLEDGRWVQTLKAEGDNAVSRLEHEVEVPAAAGEVPSLDIARHAGSRATEALQRALEGVEPSQLEERYGTRITRLKCTTRDTAGTLLEIALDEGAATCGDLSTAIVELEIEHREGPVQGLFELAHEWTLSNGLWLSTTPKSVRGERLWRQDSVQPVRYEPRQLTAREPLGQLLADVVEPILRQVLGNASEVAEGEEGAEFVHQLRVGLRRLRTALRELAPLSPSIDPAWEPILKTTFGHLGARRDAEVVAAAVRPLLEAAGAPSTSWQAPEGASPIEAVRERRFQCVLIDLFAWLNGGAPEDEPKTSAKEHIRRSLDDLHRKVVKAGRRFEQLAPEEQHRARKRLKRLRYLCEMTGSLWRRSAVDRYLDLLKPAQDALGHHNDVATAAAAFKADVPRDPRAWFAAGFLQAHLAITGEAARRSLQVVRGRDAFWRD